MKSNKTVKIIIFTALFLSAVILISVMTGAVKETSADTDSVKLPVIMYHSLLKDEKLQNDYTVSPTLFENDLKYLTENGYTTVVVKDLTDYVYGKKSLPEKCIMLTFDDGYFYNLAKVLFFAKLNQIAYLKKTFNYIIFHCCLRS